MKFWDHQHSARSETRRLLFAFALAVAVLVAAVHGALVVAWLLMVAVLLAVGALAGTAFLRLLTGGAA